MRHIACLHYLLLTTQRRCLAPKLIAPPPIVWLPSDNAGVARAEARDLEQFHGLKAVIEVRSSDDVILRRHLCMRLIKVRYVGKGSGEMKRGLFGDRCIIEHDSTHGFSGLIVEVSHTGTYPGNKYTLLRYARTLRQILAKDLKESRPKKNMRTISLEAPQATIPSRSESAV
jgi:hypothetical protein